ncbi:unnamed protein product [Paramecium pentaurelia]|uniref:Tubulin-tyrosine ligase family protein n=1 Tax=Paramecium pentaurelia TaxID=43138 RepID=A0A8S1Y5K1_9CILI|nr:unnamed protein product [Paramecium pentaurelia]
MIIQPRYSQKMADTFSNSKDFYSFHQKQFMASKPQAQRLEHLSISQRTKIQSSKDRTSSEILTAFINRGMLSTQQKVSTTKPYENSSSILIKQSYDEKITREDLLTQQALQTIEDLEKSKKILPPLRLYADKLKLKERQNQSKEKVETFKSSLIETPTIQRTIVRKNRGFMQGEQKSTYENEQSIQKMGRTSSTPLMQKSKEDKEEQATSRSGTPQKETSNVSPIKNPQKSLTKQLSIYTPQQKTIKDKKLHSALHLSQPQQQQQQQQQYPIQIDKKIIPRKKKKQNQVNIIQQQNIQKEKLTLRHTSYRCFLNKINFSNNQCISCPNKLEVPAYYYYVGLGNNGSLVKNIFRQRWWWSEVETLDTTKVNMSWTQLKQNICIEQLHPYNMDSGAQSSDSVILSYEETIGDTSDSDIDVRPKQLSITGGNHKQQSSSQHQQKKPPNYYSMKRILNAQDLQKLVNYMEEINCFDSQLIFSDCTEKLLKDIKQYSTIQRLDSRNQKMHNHMEDNWHLGNKKALFYNMRHYFQIIKEDYNKLLPVTFHVQKGLSDIEYSRFLDYYNKRNEELREIEKNRDRKDKKKLPLNLWIIKPGELTNRGNGITVCNDLNEINKIISEEIQEGRQRTYIVQQYIDNPFLYNKRKFDIRCYMLLTSQNGIFKGYWYQEGYIRTSSKEFTTKCLDRFVHLTNDAVQSKDQDYGKHEPGNKISYLEFQRYVECNYSNSKFNFFIDIYPKMRSAALDMMKATYGKIDPHRRINSFELYGLDFMIDENFKLWLIEANTNPCLEQSCPLLSRIIPTMVENLFRIAVDPIFPPPFFEEWPQNKKLFIPDNVIENNKFELIFDELIEKKNMLSLFRDNKIEQECFDIEEEEEEEEKD